MVTCGKYQYFLSVGEVTDILSMMGEAVNTYYRNISLYLTVRKAKQKLIFKDHIFISKIPKASQKYIYILGIYMRMRT